jgi:hypothetical protein
MREATAEEVIETLRLARSVVPDNQTWNPAFGLVPRAPGTSSNFVT